MTKISILKIVEFTSVDGPGFRTSIYCAGCVNNCIGCHNPQSWSISNGKWTEIDDILRVIKADEMCNVTFSGGDPMYQAAAFAELAKRIKAETGKNIWCYSGYTVEEILENEEMRELLANVDVLVDGKFVQSLKDGDLLFRGSSNQRILDAKMSLAEGKAVVYSYNPFPEFDDMKIRDYAV